MNFIRIFYKIKPFVWIFLRFGEFDKIGAQIVDFLQNFWEEKMKSNRCLSEEKLREFKEILESKKREVLEDIRNTLFEDSDGLVRDVSDEADMSADEMLRAFELRIRDREAKYLKKIEKALRKIEEGTYGICEMCGKCISYERLRLRPVAELCIECKLKQEKMEKKLGA